MLLTPFVEHVLDSMRTFGPVEARAMFGGWGLYHEGLFFALVADDVLYLKSDDENRAEFDAARLPPWIYEPKDGKPMVTLYRQAPEEGFESAEVMARWARSAYGAALRAAAKKARTRRPVVAATPAKAPRRRRKQSRAKPRS